MTVVSILRTMEVGVTLVVGWEVSPIGDVFMNTEKVKKKKDKFIYI